MESHIYNAKTQTFEPVTKNCYFCNKDLSEKETNLYHYLYKKDGFYVPEVYNDIIMETNVITVELPRCYNCKDIHENTSMIKSISTYVIIGLLFLFVFKIYGNIWMNMSAPLVSLRLFVYFFTFRFIGNYIGSIIGRYVGRKISDDLESVFSLSFVKELLAFQWKHTGNKHKLEDLINNIVHR